MTDISKYKSLAVDHTCCGGFRIISQVSLCED